MSKIMDKLRKETEKIGEIEVAIEAVYTAHCDECAVDHNDNTDPWDIAEKVYKLGWRCNAQGVLYWQLYTCWDRWEKTYKNDD